MKAGLSALFFLAVLGLKFEFFSHGFPGANCDEVVYIEPAVSYVETSAYASPGIAEQLNLKGITGLEKKSFFEAPLANFIRIPGYKCFGTNWQGRRLCDWLFYALAMAAFTFAASRFCAPQLALFVGAIFGLHPLMMWSSGRPDILSMAFGMFAFGLMLQLSKNQMSEVGRRKLLVIFIVGLFVGLAGLTHPFGAIFWGTVTGVFLLVSQKQKIPLTRVSFMFLVMAVGAITALMIWLPQILEAPASWWKQFSYMLSLKGHLTKIFRLSAFGMLYDMRKFHVPFVLVVASLCVIWRSEFNKVIRNLVIACFMALAIWRCHAFEYYNNAYTIHFWALFCFLFALACEELGMLAGRYLGGISLGMVKSCFAVVVTLEALLVAYIGFIQVSYASLPVSDLVVNKLDGIIRPSEKVLACPACYLDLRTTNKTDWYWGEALKLEQYDLIVSRYLNIPVQAEWDQWGDLFTPKQADDFAHNFQLVGRLPPAPVYVPFLPETLVPWTQELFVFRKKQ